MISDKVDLRMKKELVAPCGMNCALCSRYLARAYDVKGRGIQIAYCEGCRPRGRTCAILKKRCKKLLNNEVEFCFECGDFPCQSLQHLNNSYSKFFHVSPVENLRSLKNKGMKSFLREQRKEWRCARCGGVICIHNKKCFNCDIKKMGEKGDIPKRTPAKKR